MQEKPLFSVVVIARNEAETLPRLVESLKEFMKRGGDVNILDTGSTDGTPSIARKLGCRVEEVGTKYLISIDGKTASDINKRFIVEGEEPIVRVGDKYFHYADARNRASHMADNDVIFCYDADEINARMNIDLINSLVRQGAEQFDYNFVFAKDQWGNDSIKFIQSKAYDRRKMRWEGIIHELLQPKKDCFPKKFFLNEADYKLEHYQNGGTERHSYLKGLAVDCYNNPDNDRHSHYLARELMYNKRWKSAIQEFKRHIDMGAWHAERAQSCIYIGDCYGSLGNPQQQSGWYNKAFYIDSGRREALIRQAFLYKSLNNPQAVASYAAAAMQIPLNNYYANNMAEYTNIPHELLYWAKGWLGDILGAQEHILKALEYQPYNPTYLRDTQFYFEYPENGIEGWMRFPEQQWLYNTAKKMNSIVEIGSWKGKSTNALCSGCKDGMVTAVDHFHGSEDEVETGPHAEAKGDLVYNQFLENTKKFTNLIVNRKSSLEAAKDYEDGAFDMVFIDAGHQYHEVVADIRAWRGKARKILSGHDYFENWSEVKRAVIDEIGHVNVVDSIWWVDVEELNKRPKRPNLEEFTSNIMSGVNFTFVKRGDGEDLCIDGANGANCDGHPYSISLGKDLKRAFEFMEKKGAIISHYTNQKDVNILLHRTDNNCDEVAEFFKTIAKSDRPKIFVAPERLEKMAKILKAEHVKVPLINAYESLQDILADIPIIRHGIYMLSAGMPAKVMIANLMLRNPDATYIDCGSSFDPLIGNTRTFQISKEEFEDLYQDYALPKVSIVIPQLGRQSGLVKLLESISELEYPKELLQVVIKEGLETVPNKLKAALPECEGEYICFMANDTEFTPYSLKTAVKASIKNNKALVAFNDGEVLKDQGNICTHFIIRKDFIPEIGGEIFCTRMNHVGVDNLLWAKAIKLNQAMRCKEAIILHDHFSKSGKWDEIYEKGWSNKEEDRKILEEELSKL